VPTKTILWHDCQKHLATVERSGVAVRYLIIHGALQSKELAQEAVAELRKAIEAANCCIDYFEGGERR